jgi:hypothetical protein
MQEGKVGKTHSIPSASSRTIWIRLIASLGGFLGPRSDGEPGVKTIWIGLQSTIDAAATIKAVRMEYA